MAALALCTSLQGLRSRMGRVIVAYRKSGEPEGVGYTPQAEAQLERHQDNGMAKLPVCIAKTHLSISADPKLKGAPTGWRLPVREIRASAGAGFIYPICGDLRTTPGLGKNPAAKRIDIDSEGNIVGLS